MNTNKALELAWDFLNKTNRNVFLTGKAGTGKTTFLHEFKLKSLKRMVVVAPTGVAAINAKGVTIHSFFQMPFGPILPNDHVLSKKFSRTKINIIKSLDLIIIDEISMVRADLLDGIDRVLRRFRDRTKVFGGIQLLMIGDLQQLAPVIKQAEWELLKSHYKNGYFFSSQAFQACAAITIELEHIYRQQHPGFIKILNEIRANSLSQASAKELSKRYQPDFEPKEDENYVVLTTHNSKATTTNLQKLAALQGKAHTYSAAVDGKFPEHAYPNKASLILKIGAQVMFVKNDSNQEKRFFNGKIGEVISLSKTHVVVQCPEDDFTIKVGPEIWENITFTVDKETQDVLEHKVGSYSQIPLRLAWAITIHKSQGLTFDKAIIDAQGAFAHGQTYVALSRCKTLEGLILRTKIGPNQIVNDQHVTLFNEQAKSQNIDENELQHSKINYQLSLIADLFNCYEFIYPIRRILDLYFKNKGSIAGEIEPHLNRIKVAVVHLLKVAEGFHEQLRSIVTAENQEPVHSKILQDRFVKAVGYFSNQLKAEIETPFKEIAYTTDNTTIETNIDKQLDTIDDLITAKKIYFEGLASGFNIATFLSLRTKVTFSDKDHQKKVRKKIIDGTTNTELFERLRILRNDIAADEDIIHYRVFTQKALYAICETLPKNTKELLAVNGMGKVRVAKYGKAILELVNEFCEAHTIAASNSESRVDEVKSKQKKGDSMKASLALFKSGKTIQEIAAVRALNVNTIIGHLASFIPTGAIRITDIMPEEHYKELKALIPTKTFENLSDLKHQLDEKYSFGELRLVLNELNDEQ